MAEKERVDVACPARPVWIASMLEILPPGSRGRLEAFSGCPAVVAELERRKKEREAVKAAAVEE